MFARLIAWFFAAMSAHAAASSAAAAGEAAPGSRSLLIVHAAHLADAAQEWSQYRTATGWNVTTRSVASIAPGERSEALASELLTQITHAWGDALAGGAAEFAVLLLGDADEAGIPTFRFPQHDPDLKTHRDTHFVSDHPYRAGDTTRDQPHFALGRIPARTLDEARIALAKIKAYETGAQPAPGIWQRRINCLAGEGHFGPLDVLLETVFTAMVDTLVPPSFDMSMTYAKATSMYCPPVDALTPTILNRLAEDAFLFVYVGHGSPTALDEFHWRGERRPTLRTSDLTSLAANGAHRPIAVLACCSTGWFDLPDGEHSLAEAMLFAPHGPVAVIAGSRPTHPYANAVMLNAITRSATAGSARTLGELDLHATRDMLRSPSPRDPIDLISMPIASAMHWATSLSDHRKMHVRLYNLLGDPCMRLPDTGRDITTHRSGRTLTGTIDGMNAGTLTLAIQTARDKPANADAMQRVLGANDPELPAKSAFNYDIANDRTLATLSIEVIDGKFEVELPEAIDQRATVITLHAIGADAEGNIVTAHGAVAVQRKRNRRVTLPRRRRRASLRPAVEQDGEIERVDVPARIEVRCDRVRIPEEQ